MNTDTKRRVREVKAERVERVLLDNYHRLTRYEDQGAARPAIANVAREIAPTLDDVESIIEAVTDG